MPTKGGFNRGDRLFHCFSYGDAFTGCQSICLHNNRSALSLNIRNGGCGFCKYLCSGSRDLCLFHERLCPSFTRLNLSTHLSGTKDGQILSLQIICDSSCQRRFRPNNNKGNVVDKRKAPNSLKVVDG